MKLNTTIGVVKGNPSAPSAERINVKTLAHCEIEDHMAAMYRCQTRKIEQNRVNKEKLCVVIHLQIGMNLGYKTEKDC